jgi:TolB-like protein/Tfp pilus assembly protein PilF
MPDKASGTGAVFLSYAREDSEAARRIADALRAFGLEVWFDQSELRGGDSWDAKIKSQIRTCALFVPIVSTHTQNRTEGYFRREWKFGVERTHDMASGTAFVVPVVIDDTPEAHALVPEEFMRFQWTRLPHGVPTPQFIGQVKDLLENPRRPGAPAEAPSRQEPRGVSVPPIVTSRRPGWITGAVIAAVAAAAVAWYMLRAPRAATQPPVTPVEAKAPEVAPVSSKSIAVLPFANFSPDKDNEFFADGLQDEVITALAKIHDLKVISRTSVLAYRNPEGRNLKKIGNELGVASLLEGSVQRVGTKVHLNVQLIDARTDEHLWAESYTEDLTDVFNIESSLAKQIATALKASLTTDEQALIARRPTQNKEAYDLYLRGLVLADSVGTKATTQDIEGIIAVFGQSAALDPQFSLPHVQASILHGGLYWFSVLDSTEARRLKALAELEIAQRLAPSAPETHLAQGEYDYTCLNDWTHALEEYRAALVDLPNDAQVAYGIGRSLRRLGKRLESLEEFKRAALLDPNDENTAYTIVETVFSLHRYKETIEAANYYGPRFPDDDFIRLNREEAQFQIDGDRAAALKVESRINAFGDSPHLLAFRRALAAGDLQSADKELSDPEVTSVPNITGSISDPTSLARAYVAYLRGKKDEAKGFSLQAIAAYHATTWTPRQLPWAHMGIASAEAYAGDLASAVRDGKAASDEMNAMDSFDGLAMYLDYGAILIMAGRNNEALSVLAEIVAQPMDTAPRELLYDPIWGRLKDDPSFGKILDSVRPL